MELFQLAAEKRLAKPGVLAEQVTRMLADPRRELWVAYSQRSGLALTRWECACG
ncbi:MAG: hypothetical protein Ct9H300mP7_5020 [Verrucomicrobiota bacterium]|nr:MAG: hypothetical protein Ct9H300mP7_5020 [Verrucomicrobiota bacterium]